MAPAHQILKYMTRYSIYSSWLFFGITGTPGFLGLYERTSYVSIKIVSRPDNIKENQYKCATIHTVNDV